MSEIPKKIILGLDPGSLHFGYSVLSTEKGSFKCKDYGVIHPKAEILSDRISEIYAELNLIFQKYAPDLVAVEEIFYHRNVKSMLVLAHARAMGLLLASQYKAGLREYSPKKIKLAVTGNGAADKEAVQRMVCAILHLPEGMRLDASDAIAIGLCACFENAGGIKYGLQKAAPASKKSGGKWTQEAISGMGIKIRK